MNKAGNATNHGENSSHSAPWCEWICSKKALKFTILRGISLGPRLGWLDHIQKVTERKGLKDFQRLTFFFSPLYKNTPFVPTWRDANKKWKLALILWNELCGACEFGVHEYTLSLAQLDLLVLFSQDLCQLWVALSNEVEDQITSSVREHTRGSRRQAQCLYQQTMPHKPSHEIINSLLHLNWWGGQILWLFPFSLPSLSYSSHEDFQNHFHDDC